MKTGSTSLVSLLIVSSLVGGFSPTPFEKICSSKWLHAPQFQGENKEYLSCHQLEAHGSCFELVSLAKCQIYAGQHVFNFENNKKIQRK